MLHVIKPYTETLVHTSLYTKGLVIGEVRNLFFICKDHLVEQNV